MVAEWKDAEGNEDDNTQGIHYLVEPSGLKKRAQIFFKWGGNSKERISIVRDSVPNIKPRFGQ